MDRRGGEAKKITDVKGDIEDYVWKPDGSGILLVMRDPDYSDTAKTKIRTPYVMDRYQFKQDYEGYLDNRKSHLYFFDLKTKKTDTLTKGNFNETNPAFSPDGNTIAFVSNRTPDPDKNENTEIYLMEAKAGATMKKITSWPGNDVNPQWSPDGKNIAYLQSTSNEAFTMYGHDMIALISKNGGEPKLISQATDRPIYHFTWNKGIQGVFGYKKEDVGNTSKWWFDRIWQRGRT